MSLDSLGQGLAGRREGGGGAMKTLRRAGNGIIDILPGMALRQALKRRLRRLLAGGSRRRLEEIARSQYRVRITKDERTRQIVLTKL